MKAKIRRRSHDRKPPAPRLHPVREGASEMASSSPTAVAAEALRTGVVAGRVLQRREQLPHEGETIRVGDPDDDALANEYGGEDTPGGDSPTPDQSSVDEIGRAYGLQDEDTGCLRSAGEVLARRDRRRSELQAPGKPRV